MFHGRRGAVAAACVLLVTACSSSTGAPSTKPSPVIARVASDTITLAQFNVRYESALVSITQGGAGSNPAQTTSLRATVLRSLIIDTVIREEATQLGLEATAKEIQAQVAADAASAGGMSALLSNLAGAGGSIAQLEDEISSSLNEQRLEDHFAKARATMIEQTLASGANFIATAKEFSDDTGTRGKGGDLGVLTIAELKKYNQAFAAAVEALKVGAYTKTPIHDAGGYDIVMLYSKSAKGFGVRHILVYAGTPYTVTDRPSWFAVSLFTAIAQLCQAKQIDVTLSNAGGNPCTPPSPGATPASPSAKPTAAATH
jgi:PPIC-type PPIASE domain/SurA N-terminal domain